MDAKQFYTYKDGSKVELCKKCLTMHLDPFNPDTFVWILEKLDVPYLPEEWNVIRDRDYAKNPAKVTGMGVFGKYLSKTKLKQYRNPANNQLYGFADSEMLLARNAEKREAALAQQKRFEQETQAAYDRGEISENQYKVLMSTEAQHEAAEARLANDAANPYKGSDDPANRAYNPYNEDQFMSEEELNDPAADLTQEDKLYLAMKWGRTYKPSQWLAMEKNYNDMKNSFDIQDADTENTLIHLCKTNLKMNEAIDIGDLDGYQKLARVYESLRKSAKFTGAQNKEQSSDFVDCVGTMVAYCEKNGGKIPKYDISVDHDIVDTVIRDLKEYTRSLIYEDTALARQIEDYLKRREIQEDIKKDKEEAKKNNKEVTINDEDYQENSDRIAEEKAQDNEEYYEEEE
jgi:hypothetical protein